MILLEDRTIIAITGVDSHKFLQGIISNDMAKLQKAKFERQPAIFTALLNPQGKFLHDFFIIQSGDELLLDVEARQVEMLLATLTKYRLRSKVQFQPRNCHIYVDFNGASHDCLNYIDPRHSNMGVRVISTTPLNSTGTLQQYHTHRIANCIPEGWSDMIYEKSFLLENNYDAINAVDFSKGCYVGQEVTARAKYRGEVRKRIYVVNGENLSAFGTEIMANAVKIGEMRSSTGRIGLAQLRIAELANAINNDFLTKNESNNYIII